MRRAPKVSPYLIIGTLARSAEGQVCRGYDSNTDREVLVITSIEGDERSAELLRSRIDTPAPEAPKPLVVHRDEPLVWLVLPPTATTAAVNLIGLAEPPVQNWFAHRWGWPHLHAKTVRQLGFRCMTTVVGALAVVWLYSLLRLLFG